MKSFIVVIALASLAGFANASDIRLKRIKFSIWSIEDCVSETGFDAEIADKMIMGNTHIDSPEAKCFIKCFFKKTGFIDDDGEAKPDFIADSLLDTCQLGRSSLEKIAKKCAVLESTDPCEKSFEIFSCLFKEVGKFKDEL